MHRLSSCHCSSTLLHYLYAAWKSLVQPRTPSSMPPYVCSPFLTFIRDFYAQVCLFITSVTSACRLSRFSLIPRWWCSTGFPFTSDFLTNIRQVCLSDRHIVIVRYFQILHWRTQEWFVKKISCASSFVLFVFLRVSVFLEIEVLWISQILSVDNFWKL